MNKKFRSMSGVQILASLLMILVVGCLVWPAAIPAAAQHTAVSLRACYCGSYPSGRCKPCGLPPGGGNPNPSPGCDGCLPWDRMALPKLYDFYRRSKPLLEDFTDLVGSERNSKFTAVLLYVHPTDDPSRVQLQPLARDGFTVGADGGLKLDSLDSIALPQNAPSGEFLMVACPGDCSAEDALAKLQTGEARSKAFQLPVRITGIDLRPFENTSRNFDAITAKWDYEMVSDDDLQVLWYRNGQKYGTMRSTEFALQEVDLQSSWYGDSKPYEPRRFTDFLAQNTVFDFLNDDRQGTVLHAQSGAIMAFPGLKKVFPWWYTPPLESGTYKVEVYLNGVLEGTKEVTIP